MRPMLLQLAVIVSLAVPAGAQDLIGHGGPVGALDAGQGLLISGGFDTRAILWDLDTATAGNVTRFHAGNVTAVRLLPTGGFVTAGQDGRLAIWQADGRTPGFATPPTDSAVASLAVSDDGAQVAAGYWDGRVLRLDPGTQEVAVFQAHSDRVTGLSFLPGGDLVTVGGDLFLARWTPQSELQFRRGLPDLPNGLARADVSLAVIFADGALRRYDDRGNDLDERFLSDRPLVAVAAGGKDIAVAALDGTVWVLQSDDLVPRPSFIAADGPVWGLTITDGQVFTSGADGVIRRWSRDGDALGGFVTEAEPAADDGSRGAEIWKNCAVCHSLEPDDHSMAGPSLYGIFGRRVASQAGYDYSDALRHLDIIWTPETLSELFTDGPEAYTPGSRMPEQRIAAPEDRDALADYLQRIVENHE
ncbi:MULTISPECIES: c-type cytochrome [unclassified Yoonia]|uniref:c-type cytochrome n=1 Tax=unclassified Yoonia TaxID=2629118 RepID=UPI002AFE8F3D|nr:MULTISPECIES: c-type cytochrome [unclassified Yoonia]